MSARVSAYRADECERFLFLVFCFVTWYVNERTAAIPTKKKNRQWFRKIVRTVVRLVCVLRNIIIKFYRFRRCCKNENMWRVRFFYLEKKGSVLRWRCTAATTLSPRTHALR